MITRVAFENFGPFRKPVVLDMADQGFVLVRGRNLVSQAADANGVGKTSIAHAICWGLYGEDLSGRKADAVACRFTKDQCEVSIHLKDDLGEWGICRTRRPASLTVYGIPGVLENEDAAVIQQKIDDRLGRGLRTFKNAAVFGQGQFDRFRNADQAEQMRMLDEIQGVDFREALKNAKDWRTDLGLKLGEQCMFADKAKIRGDGLLSTIAALKAARDEFEAVKMANVYRGTDRISKIEATLDALTEEEKKIAEEQILLGELQKALRGAALAGEAVNTAATTKLARQFDVEKIEEEIQEISEALTALESAGECPTCRRGVKTKTDVAKVRKLFEPSLALARATRNVKALALRDAEKALQEATEAGEQARAALEALAPVGEDPLRLIARLEVTTGPREAAKRATTRQILEDDLAATQRSLQEAQTATWDGAATLDETDARLAELQETSRKAIARSLKIEAALVMAEYWVEAFGDRGIRSMMVDGVASYVNDRVREHLDVLAAGEATMLMSATTDLKKGGTKERINFKPEWSWGGAGKDDGSGGQDRRMDLALFAAVQDLAETRSARPFPLKIWDEPTDGLDSRGMELFTQWVAHQARTRGTGLLISHNKEVTESVSPDHIWTVVLTADGAHVEVD